MSDKSLSQKLLESLGEEVVGDEDFSDEELRQIQYLYDSLQHKRQGWVEPPPTLEDVKRAYLLALEGRMKQADKILGSYGVESETGPSGKSIRYCNMGDTYDPTLIRDGSGEVWVGDWGTWLEEDEKNYGEEEEEVKCGNCGAWTPMEDHQDWNDVVCRSCGNYVNRSEKPSIVHAEDDDE